MVTSEGLEKLGYIPHVDFRLERRGGVVAISQWNSDQSQPSESAIEAAHAEWQAEYDAQEYARNRQAEYPSLDDLIVALWEGVVEERMAAVTSLEAERQAVKAKYPK